MSRTAPRRAVAALAGVVVVGGGAGLLHAQPLPPATPAELFDRLEEAWREKSMERYLELWPAEDASREEEFAARRLLADELELLLYRPAEPDPAAASASARAELFVVEEPRARLEEWAFHAVRGERGWSLQRREAVGLVDGLMHLSLDPAGFQAAGLTLQLEDFTLRMLEGTLFASPASVGATALVFVGKGEVRFRPRPPAEQEQLAKFCGSRELVEPVERAFVRLNPDDLPRVLGPLPLVGDPQAARRRDDAFRYYADHALRTFVLDGVGPRSPWWLVPASGETTVTFDAGRRGTLAFSISISDREGISLYHRDKARHVNLYPLASRERGLRIEVSRQADVLHHDLQLRFEPGGEMLSGWDTLRLAPAPGQATLQLQLDDDLRVHAVTSRAGAHRFFRMRGRGSVLVPLGNLAGEPDVELTVHYSGRLAPGPIEREVLQLFDPEEEGPTLSIESVLVYTNARAWYPRVSDDDYATARLRFDVPEGQTAITGGVPAGAATEQGRSVFEYSMRQPAKYFSVAIGRIEPVAERLAAGVRIQAHAVPRLRGEAARQIEAAAAVIELFSEEFGPSPYPGVELVLLEGEIPGGHAPPGMVLLSLRPPLLPALSSNDPALFPGARHFFLAHELAHQWWGHGVAGASYRERWVSEAFAHYAAALWVRRSQGEDEFRSVLRRMAQWARRHNGDGPVHLGSRVGHIQGDARAYRAIVYDKGAYVLHVLRGIVGEPVFRAAMHELQAGHRFETIVTPQLLAALERASGRDLAAYFDAWVYGSALPSLRYRERWSGGTLTLELRPRDLPGPVPIQVALSLRGGGEERRELLLSPEGGSFELELPAEPRKIELNSDEGLLLERIER